MQVGRKTEKGQIKQIGNGKNIHGNYDREKIAGAQKGKKCVNKFVPGSVQSNNFSFSCSHLCSQVCNAKGALVTQRVNWDQAADYWVNNKCKLVERLKRDKLNR